MLFHEGVEEIPPLPVNYWEAIQGFTGR